jgi:elongation factor 1 alpha-like protein
MRQATIEVKAKLGSEYQPSEAEIQEALWYYYFDVDSSVNYLKGE